jgi:DNA-binding beta-propeller fold protein YncE
MRILIGLMKKLWAGRCTLHAALLPASRYTLYAILFAVVAGCATSGPPPKPTGEFYWPAPPDTPKVKWVTQWSGSYDFDKPNPLLTFLIGEERGENLSRPGGVLADSAGNVYVAESDRGVIFVFDVEKNTLNFLGQGTFTAPVALAIDNKAGVLYVTDTKQDKVIGIDKRSGQVVVNIGAPGEFQNPAGLAFDEEKEKLYVSDSKAHYIRVYEKNGKYLYTIGKRGYGDGEFNYPGYLAFSRGKLYVTDTLNYRVQIFDADGKFLKKFGKIGDSPGLFSRPKGIGVDSEGNIYVVDAAFGNFQVFDADTQLLLWVGHAGRDAGGMNLPSGLYVDRQDRIYVSDTFNRRIQVFQYLKQQPGK